MKFKAYSTRFASYCSDLPAEKLTNYSYSNSASHACCISELRIFLAYKHPWIPHCPDIRDLTVPFSSF